MATVGVYDYDFFNYKNVIPNLEVMKLITYYREHNHIAVLSPQLNSAPYTKMHVRKDYNDGIYPQEMFKNNVVYGGKAFTENYIPLDLGMEHSIPDPTIYEKFKEYYMLKPSDEFSFKRLMKSAHVRLSLDSFNLDSDSFIRQSLMGKKFIVFHDYNLAAIKDGFEYIQDIVNTKYYKNNPTEINPYLIGNKFPVCVSNLEDIQKWESLPIMSDAFSIQYDGLLNNAAVEWLANNDNKRFNSQLYYNFSKSYQNEEDFLLNGARDLYKQVLYLKRKSKKILLTYDNNFFVTKEMKNFVELLNNWYNLQWQENFMRGKQTLYDFASSKKLWSEKYPYFHMFHFTKEEIREVFQYIREHNYELFKMFYEWDAVLLKEGEIINEWTGNP